jgi:hypothetical protein
MNRVRFLLPGKIPYRVTFTSHEPFLYATGHRIFGYGEEEG